MNSSVANGRVRAAAPRILVLGYGNPGRQDDGLGPALAEAVEELNMAHVDVDVDYQLNIEDGSTISAYDIVVFADASTSVKESYDMVPVKASEQITFTSHTVSPESILAICEDHFGAQPETWVMAIRGYEFEFREGLTTRAKENLGKAMTHLRARIQQWEEQAMETAGSLKKTVLTIDDDPDIRAALRIVLVAEGFSVGEAASGEDGLKTAERIKPDAIIVDLMMEAVDSGSTVVKELKKQGFEGPIYMLSSAGDTVRYNIDANALGLSGIFQKPVDPKELVKTVRAKLGV